MAKTTGTENIYVTPRRVKECIKITRTADQPVVLWGPPGIGKSQIVHQAAEEDGIEIEDIRAVLLDPVDVKGLPHVKAVERVVTKQRPLKDKDGRQVKDERGMVVYETYEETETIEISDWAQPGFLPRAGKGYLFLDELNRAPQLVQNSFLQLILDRRVGDYHLPPGWTPISACNDAAYSTGVTTMNEAMRARFMHLDVMPSINDWCEWAVKNNIHPMVVAYLRFQEENFHYIKDIKTARVHPNPRGWSMVSKIAWAYDEHKKKYKGDEDSLKALATLELPLYTGIVGHGAAASFVGYYKFFYQCPDPMAIMTNPDTYPVPENPAICYALATTLGRFINKDNFGRISRYLNRMDKEFNVAAVKDALVLKEAELKATTDFQKWALTHGKSLLKSSR